MDTTEYVRMVADLLNQDSDSKQRTKRVREANRELFSALHGGTTADADLALAAADSFDRRLAA